MWGPCLLSCNKAENFLSIWTYFAGRISISEWLATKQPEINFLISLTFVLSPLRASSKVQELHASPKANSPSPPCPHLWLLSTSVSSLYYASFVLSCCLMHNLVQNSELFHGLFLGFYLGGGSFIEI